MLSVRLRLLPPLKTVALRYTYSEAKAVDKKAAIPENFNYQQGKAPVSKQYDAVKYVYQWYVDNHVQTLPWKRFQQEFQQFAARYNALFTQIRHNKPQVTAQDLKAWLDSYQPESDYGAASFSKYNDPEHMFRSVEQLVIQINRGASAEAVLAQDPVMASYVDMVNQSSALSQHPATMETVGWLRVDFVDAEWLLVDEVQSDLVNSVTQAKWIMTAQNFDEFVAGLTNDKVRELVTERVNPQNFRQVKRMFEQSGYTLEKLEDIRAKLIGLFENWAEYALATLLELARQHSIKNVAIHTAESIAERDPSVESDKVKMYYDNLAKSFGFKKQQVNVGELRGDFWVRKTGRFTARFLNK